MNLLKKFNKLTNETKRLIGVKAIAWGMPVSLIPALRYMQDSDKKPSLRKELFVRDFGAYSVGTGLYMGASYGLGKALKTPKAQKLNLSKNKKVLLPEFAAGSLFCLWSGVFAPKFSRKLNHRKDSAESDNKVANKVGQQETAKQVNFSHRLNSFPMNSTYSKFRI